MMAGDKVPFRPYFKTKFSTERSATTVLSRPFSRVSAAQSAWTLGLFGCNAAVPAAIKRSRQSRNVDSGT